MTNIIVLIPSNYQIDEMSVGRHPVNVTVIENFLLCEQKCPREFVLAISHLFTRRSHYNDLGSKH